MDSYKRGNESDDTLTAFRGRFAEPAYRGGAPRQHPVGLGRDYIHDVGAALLVNEERGFCIRAYYGRFQVSADDMVVFHEADYDLDRSECPAWAVEALNNLNPTWTPKKRERRTAAPKPLWRLEIARDRMFEMYQAGWEGLAG